jgi:dCTP deaminase
MSILADWQILKLCEEQQMIVPFERASVKTLETAKGIQRIMSYGVSSYGYDIVLAPEELKIFSNLNGKIIDPRKIDPDNYYEPKLLKDEDGLWYVIMPPNSTMLGHTREYFKMPRNVLGECLGKSTYARACVSLLVTPLEPGWEGKLVVEIVNHANAPVKIYPDQGIGQLLFHENEECQVSYADRGGKYQGQRGTQDALV